MDGLFDMATLTQMFTEYAPKVVGAILTLIIGFWIAGAVTRGVRKLLVRSGVDETVTPFLGSLVNTGLKIMVLLAVVTSRTHLLLAA